MSNSASFHNEATEHEHIPLMGGVDPGDDDDDSKSQDIRRRSTNTHDVGPPRPLYLRLLTISAFLVSIVSFICSGTQISSQYYRSNTPKLDVASLRRPSLYIGLDRVPKIKAGMPGASDGSTAEMPTNDDPTAYPGAPQQVIRINTDYQDTKVYKDGWVLLTKNDIVMMKFVPSAGITTCRITSTFPRRKDLGDKMLTLEGRQAKINVQLITSMSSLNNISSGQQSSADRTLGYLSAEFGRNDSTASFPCMHQTPIIIRTSCTPNDCRVEYREDPGNLPHLGLL